MSLIVSYTYQKYEEYSTKYIIDITKLNDFVKSLPDDTDTPTDYLTEQWIISNCYQIISSHSIDDFNKKINDNITIAQKINDIEYIKHISNKLSVTINTTENVWNYKPNKIKLMIKKLPLNSTGFRINNKIGTLLGISTEKVYRYKSDIIRLIHQYIYNEQLQHKSIKKIIVPNQKLQEILLPLKEGESNYTYYNLAEYANLGEPMGSPQAPP